MARNGILELFPIGNPFPMDGDSRRYDAVTAILGGVTAGTKLLGGIFGSRAANSAAELQAKAAEAAGKKVEDAAALVNPAILDAAKRAASGVQGAAGAAADRVSTAADASATGVTNAADKAAAGVADATSQANKLLDPYITAGGTAADQLNKGLAAGGDFNKMPTMADLQIDPGYAFRQKQAEQALERSAAAHGAVGSGGYLKDLNDYVQGSASQEYQNAFNRFETATQNRFSNLNSVAGLGRTAATTAGGNLINSGEYGGNITTDAAKFAGNTRTAAAEYAGDKQYGAAEYSGNADMNSNNLASSNTLNAAKAAADYLTQGANAQAAGKVAGSNALWSGIGSAVDSGVNTLLYGNLFKSPSKNYFSPSWDLSNVTIPPPNVRPTPAGL